MTLEAIDPVALDMELHDCANVSAVFVVRFVLLGATDVP